MLRLQSHQFQAHATSVPTNHTMRLVWMHIVLALLVFMVDGAKKSDPSLDSERKVGDQKEPIGSIISSTRYLEDLAKKGDEEADEGDEEEEDLPILPPIILLDFTNSSSDEKSKRTVNGNLGYGYNRNNVVPGKYNYYFPGGKTGTTVSIEESISPFLPKTIVEGVKPVNEKPYGNQIENTYEGPAQFRSFPTVPTVQGQQQLAPTVGYSNVQSIFGQRTKLQKTSSTDFDNFRGFSSTPRPDTGGYFTPKSTVYTTARPAYEGYSTTRPSAYSSPIITYPNMPEYNVGEYSGQRLAYEASTASPIAREPGYSSGSPVLPSLGNFPKYTIENGVRYEHKILWKYPDGKVSEIGPPPETNSYDPRYNDLPAKPSPSSGYRDANPASHIQNLQRPSYPDEIYSQNPARFTMEQAYPPQQAPYVSSASLSSQDYNYRPQVPRQPYRLRYQPQFTAENQQDASLQNGLSPSSTFAGTKETGSSYYEHKPISKYAINSPNPEYTDSTSYNLFTANGQLSPAILEKYSPQVQRYLKKVFTMRKHANGQRNGHADSKPYSNLQYSNLLSYNPSISQYIRNPASILNAQPTFIQLGNSLIPVIILRVDGVPPIQPNLTPNINLKALLQQYLTQYANSINNLAQNANYEIGNETPGKSQSSTDPHSDLTRLTQNLSQLSQNPSFARNFAQSFAKNVQSPPTMYDPYAYLMRNNYDNSKELDANKNDGSNSKYTIRKSRPQKVKSVEIIEDPRFTSYKVNS